MRISLDLCCLKRPFDAQESPLVRLETEAVLSFLGPAVPDAVFLGSAAHRLENAFNTVVPRRQAVSSWLSAGPLDVVPVSELATRAGELVDLGFARSTPSTSLPPNSPGRRLCDGRSAAPGSRSQERIEAPGPHRRPAPPCRGGAP